MSAAELELLASRFEQRTSRTSLPDDDPVFIQWRDQSGPNCLPCLLEDLE